MAEAGLSLDHVGVIARDLAAAARCWERLGFTLSPRSRQRGAVPGCTGMQPWATANRCAIFERGYLELIGIVDASAHNPWQRFLERFEGAHLVALRCADADETFRRLAAQAPFLEPPVARERTLSYRGEERTLRFRNIFSRDAACPEARYIVIEHQTPELLWQAELMQHENGAIGLDEAWIVADDPAVARRAAALDGIAKVTSTRAFAERFDWMPPAPCVAAVTIAFSDRDRALRLLQQRAVPVQRSADDVWVRARDTGGFILRLTQDASAASSTMRAGRP